MAHYEDFDLDIKQDTPPETIVPMTCSIQSAALIWTTMLRTCIGACGGPPNPQVPGVCSWP